MLDVQFAFCVPFLLARPFGLSSWSFRHGSRLAAIPGQAIPGLGGLHSLHLKETIA